LQTSQPHPLTRARRRLRPAAALLALLTSLTGPAALARNLDFTYIDLEYITEDPDKNDTFALNGSTVTFDTDVDRGYNIGGALQIYRGLFVFGHYMTAENDYTATITGGGTDIRIDDKFDLARARVGAGYRFLLTDSFAVYGKVSWDYIDIDDISIGALNLGDDDDSGVGFQGGVRWMALPSVELEGFGRYTDVGDTDVDEGFDDDVLGGFKARWYPFGAEDINFQVGYEWGAINTFAGGVRWVF
jgi:hypothetical protein